MRIFSLHKSPLFLRIVFVLALFLMLFVSALTYRHVESLSDSSDLIEHTYKVSIEIEQIYTNIKDLEIERRNYLLTYNKKIPYIINTDISKIIKNIAHLKKMINDNDKQKKRLIELESLVHQKFKIVDESLFNSYYYSELELKSCLLDGRNIMIKISNLINQMLVSEGQLLVERGKNNTLLNNTTPKIIFITLFSTIAIICLAFVKINKDLDDTQLKNQLLELNRESNNLAEQIGNYGTWFLNLDTNEYTFSENEYRLLGVEPFEFKASLEDFLQYIHPDDLEYVKQVSTNMVTLNTLVPFTYRIIRKDGAIRYLRGNGKTVINKSGEKILIGTTNDVTSEIEAQEVIEERSRELEANNKELQAFNYVASHDLQEPLRKIQTFISRLIDNDFESLSASGQQYLTKIQVSSQRMRVLIDDLLQFSRTNKSDNVFECSDLNELLENSKSDLVQIIEDKQAEITNMILPQLDVIPFQIQQLFTNLISNSLKYAKENVTPKIDIKVSLIDASKDLEILVNNNAMYYKIVFTDNGIGFEQEYAEKIFILFNRLHNKGEYGGTGIGLAICKKIADNHKGFIFAEGIANTGSKFTIFLPA